MHVRPPVGPGARRPASRHEWPLIAVVSSAAAPDVEIRNYRGHHIGRPSIGLPICSRLDASWIVVRGAVDEGAHRPGGHGFRWVRFKRNLRAREPGAERRRGEDYRYPMVDRCRDLVGGRGEDRERLAVLHADQPGPLRPALAPPFVEPVRRDQAAAGGRTRPGTRVWRAVSERALTGLWPIRESLAQSGIEPQRGTESRRRPSRPVRTTATSWSGAML